MIGWVFFFFLPLSVTQEMDRLRQELDRVRLEQKRIEQELKSQESFIVQLQQERDRLIPLINERRKKISQWLIKLPVPSSKLSGLLPLPRFNVDDANRNAWTRAFQEQLSVVYSELMQLQKHWRETESQMENARTTATSQGVYYSELKESLKETLRQKEKLRRRLAQVPNSLERLPSTFDVSEEMAAWNSAAENLDVPIALPVEGKIVRNYGKRVHPRYQTVTESKGVHIAVPSGQEVHAVLPGHVVFVGNQGLFGSVMMIRHSERLSTLVGGFSRVYVRPGDKVAYQQPLGLSGHGYALEYEGVYFEVRDQNRAIHPLKWIEKWNKSLEAQAALRSDGD